MSRSPREEYIPSHRRIFPVRANSETLFLHLFVSQPVEGTLSLFGFPDTPAELAVLPRSAGWRLGRSSAFIGTGLVLAPLVGLIPPHAPWVLAVLGTGGLMGIRKWKERFTILSLQGECPKCGGPLSLKSGTPLRSVMTVPCSGCNHDSRLTVALLPLETTPGATL